MENDGTGIGLRNEIGTDFFEGGKKDTEIENQSAIIEFTLKEKNQSPIRSIS